MTKRKYKQVHREPVRRDPQKDKHDWFAEQVRALGPEHEFKPAEESNPPCE